MLKNNNEILSSILNVSRSGVYNDLLQNTKTNTNTACIYVYVCMFISTLARGHPKLHPELNLELFSLKYFSGKIYLLLRYLIRTRNILFIKIHHNVNNFS